MTGLCTNKDSHSHAHLPPHTQVCKYLSQCVAGTANEAACGLLLVGLALHMVSPAQRYAPEPLTFLTDALWSFLDPAATHNPVSAKAKRKAEGSSSSSKKQDSSAKSAAGTAVKRGADGLSVPRVVPGALTPSTQGPALAAVAVQELQLLPWLERVSSHVGSSSNSSSSSSASKKEGKGGRHGEEDGFKLGMLSTMLKVRCVECSCGCQLHRKAIDCERRRQAQLHLRAPLTDTTNCFHTCHTHRCCHVLPVSSVHVRQLRRP